MRNLLFLILLVFVVSCNSSSEKNPADRIVSEAIEKAGGEKYEKAEIDFVFRKKHYSSSRNNGVYEFSRIMKDSLGEEVKDVLNNEGVKRFRDGVEVELNDSIAGVIGESVNSVHYFVQLPYGLDGEAVNRKIVGEDTINDQSYYEIEVTFDAEGGGEDHEDVYLYWIQKEDYTIDFMAYRFFVNDGGIRFRVATNPRVINGIRFVDYENYKTKDLSTPLEQLDELYMEGKLTKVSEIENEVLKVQIN